MEQGGQDACLCGGLESRLWSMLLLLNNTFGLRIAVPATYCYLTFVKCGFAGDNFPRAVFPCIVGRPMLRHGEITTQASATKDVQVGKECLANRHQLEVRYPVSNGIVHNWEDMGHVWDHTFHERLRIDTAECKIMLTDPPLNPAKNRERMVETMLETYRFEAAQVQIQAVLTLYAQGLLTGLVVDSGDGVTHMVAIHTVDVDTDVPVVDGLAFPHVTKRLNIAGRHTTTHLIDLLLRRGYAFNRSADFETVRQIKEELCYVAADYERELQLARDTTVVLKSYTLPDGRVIQVGPERFMAPEALFRPELIGVEGPGLAELVFKCIQEMDLDNRMPVRSLSQLDLRVHCVPLLRSTTYGTFTASQSMFQHIILSGGSSMYPGLPTRLEKELKALYLQHVLKGNKEGLKKLKLGIEDPPRRKHFVFLGASVLADLMKDNPEFWVSRQEWEEHGPKILDKKCGRA
eukprot:jgi/Chlat1/6174/Chrsp41S09036